MYPLQIPYVNVLERFLQDRHFGPYNSKPTYLMCIHDLFPIFKSEPHGLIVRLAHSRSFETVNRLMGSADDRSTPPDPRNSEIMSTNSKKSGSGATKISFSLAPKASARCMPVNSDDQEKVEYLNEFDPNKSVAFNIKVIPKLENSWRPQKNVQMKDDDSQLKFEAEVQPTGIEPDTQYGLNLRSRVSVPNDSHENGKLNIQEAFLSKEELEKWKLRKDLEGLPDVASVEDYIKMPVEDFGEALLRGMGWTEGTGIGLNANEPVMPYECIRRVGRLGLGATPRKP